MTVIDCDARTAIDRIELGKAPCATMINPLNDSLYVAISGRDSVTRIDLASRRIVAEIPVGRGPVGVNLSSSGDRVYVGNRGEGTVSVIGAGDDQEWVRLPVGEAPAGLAADPRSGYLLVSNAGSASVSVLEDLVPGPIQTAAAAHPLVGRSLPDFALPDAKTGKLRRSREWSERKYILNFFASW